MPKPNSDRHRISVDVGAYDRWILDRLAEHMAEALGASGPLPDSQIVRCLLIEGGRAMLPADVWDERPRHLKT